MWVKLVKEIAPTGRGPTEVALRVEHLLPDAGGDGRAAKPVAIATAGGEGRGVVLVGHPHAVVFQVQDDVERAEGARPQDDGVRLCGVVLCLCVRGVCMCLVIAGSWDAADVMQIRVWARSSLTNTRTHLILPGPVHPSWAVSSGGGGRGLAHRGPPHEAERAVRVAGLRLQQQVGEREG